MHYMGIYINVYATCMYVHVCKINCVSFVNVKTYFQVLDKKCILNSTPNIQSLLSKELWSEFPSGPRAFSWYNH